MKKTSKAVLEALAEHGPLSTDGLRKALPATAVRSLGEQGKKAGVSSTLPPALRILEFARQIERVPEEGRIDRERYLWRLPDGASSPNAPSVRDSWQREAADSLPELLSEIAALYLRAAGLSTVRSFASWCGVSQRDAKAALSGVGAEVVEVEGESEPYFLDWHAAAAAADESALSVALLPFEDSLLALHGGAAHRAGASDSRGAELGTTQPSDARQGQASQRSFVADGRWPVSHGGVPPFDKVKPEYLKPALEAGHGEQPGGARQDRERSCAADLREHDRGAGSAPAGR